MPTAKRLWVVQSLSLLRLSAALLFAALAFQSPPTVVPSCLFAVAMVSDLADGWIARKFRATTFFGKILDLVSDKSLTVVALLYAAARGVSLFPLGIIAVREMISLGMRSIVVDGQQLLATSRIFGGVMAALLWGTTLFLILTSVGLAMSPYIDATYWGCAGIFTVNLLMRVWAARRRIRASWDAEQVVRRP